MKRRDTKDAKSRTAKNRRVFPVSNLSPGSQPRLDLRIEKPIYGGNFLARHEGKAVFVPLTLPGEQVRVHLVDDKAKRGYAVAELDEVVTPAPERIPSKCPHFGPCGGCQYQHTGYTNQLALKQAVLRETFERAGIVIPGGIPVLAAEPWAYRNRIRLAIDAAGRVGYRERRSHQLVIIRECPISAGLLVNAALTAAELLRNLFPQFRPTEMALFCDPGETALLLTLFVTQPVKLKLAEFSAALQQTIPQLTGMELVLDQRESFPKTLDRWGDLSLTYATEDAAYRVDHGAFFQVNRWLVDRLVEHVTARQSGAIAWDLFAGVGLFARQLTPHFEKVIAVESAPSATKALEANLAGTSGQTVSASTLDFLRENHSKERPDLIVVDPPRTGLGAEITDLLAKVAAPRLVYVSCDPATLARDLHALLASGYAIESVAMTDLFPQTFHLETVVHLRRS